VSRQHPELFTYLTHRFADTRVTVMLDRRLGPRRQASRVVAHERRCAERREHPEVDDTLRVRSLAILRLDP
jgi:hypothetical protein